MGDDTVSVAASACATSDTLRPDSASVPSITPVLRSCVGGTLDGLRPNAADGGSCEGENCGRQLAVLPKPNRHSHRTVQTCSLSTSSLLHRAVAVASFSGFLSGP